MSVITEAEAEAEEKTVLVPIANGSEELEFCTIVDLLRRGGLDVTVASVEDSLVVTCSRKVKIEADTLLSSIPKETSFDLIVLPGGGPGSRTLGACERLIGMLRKQSAIPTKFYAAICAAPALSLEPNGLIGTRLATAFPSLQSKLPNQQSVSQAVVVDGNLITSQGVGTAIPFALKLIELLSGVEVANKVAKEALLRV